MSVQPFIVLGASQRAAVLESLDADLQTWLAQWIGPRASDHPAVVAEVEGDGHDVNEALKFWADDKRWCVCSIGSDDLHTLALQLVGAAVGTEIRLASIVMRRFALASLSELVRAWIGRQDDDIESIPLTGKVDDLIPSSATQPGQGMLSFTASIGAAQIVCWLPLATLLPRIGTPPDRRRSEAPAPVSVDQAVASQRVGLRATVGDVDLSLDAVSQLRPGDVVRLEKPISAPLTMYIRDSKVGFSGYLGRQQDSLAFRVVEKL